MTAINKSLMVRSFNRAASAYAGHSQLQQGAGLRLLSLLGARQSLCPERIADIGCATGFTTRAVAQRWPEAQITALDLAANMVCGARKNLSDQSAVHFVCADMEKLPFQSTCLDLIFSSSAVQWSADHHLLATEFQRVLKPGGLLCLSSYGPGTLAELRDAWAHADAWEHTIEFESRLKLCKLFASCDLDIHLAHSQTEVVLYGSVNELLHSLKKAGNS